MKLKSFNSLYNIFETKMPKFCNNRRKNNRKGLSLYEVLKEDVFGEIESGQENLDVDSVDNSVFLQENAKKLALLAEKEANDKAIKKNKRALAYTKQKTAKASSEKSKIDLAKVKHILDEQLMSDCRKKEEMFKMKNTLDVSVTHDVPVSMVNLAVSQEPPHKCEYIEQFGVSSMSDQTWFRCPGCKKTQVEH